MDDLMIDEARTLELFGYTSDELTRWSLKHIVLVCDECGKYKVIRRANYKGCGYICASCVRIGMTFSEEHKKQHIKGEGWYVCWRKPLHVGETPEQRDHTKIIRIT